jgi:hypothetical protein
VQRIDWGEALTVPTFYGHEWEMDLLTRWVVEERCRVVSVLGLGGIGKSALAVSLMHQVAPIHRRTTMELREQFPTMTEVRQLEYVGFSSEQIACLFRVKVPYQGGVYHESTPEYKR